MDDRKDMFVSQNGFLTILIPPINTAYVFRVINVRNPNFDTIPYGPLPIPTGTVLPTLPGSPTPSVTVPADGVLPGFAVVAGEKSIMFPPPPDLRGLFDPSDMWFVGETPKKPLNTLFHIYHKISPEFLRVQLEIPKGTSQLVFQEGRAVMIVSSTFGFRRGNIEVIQFPGIHYGYTYANDTNMNLITNVTFYYKEYEINIPDDPALIFDIILGRIPSKRWVFPVQSIDGRIKLAFNSAYGFEGFPIFRIDERDKAIAEYKNILMKKVHKDLVG
jgi:hypothetical protein